MIVDGFRGDRANPMVADRFAESHVRAQVYSPYSETVRVHIAAIGNRVHGGTQFGDFSKTQCGPAVARSLGGKIKKKYVVLLVLEGRSQREKFSATRSVRRAKHDSGSGLQTRKEPAIARSFTGNGVRK